jgi:hypothetical protein
MTYKNCSWIYLKEDKYSIELTFSIYLFLKTSFFILILALTNNKIIN